jgi:predicted ArsR family transcriptional regulator
MSQQDWEQGFVQKHYAKLISILVERLGKEQVRDILRQLGVFCSSQHDDIIRKYQRDFPGWCAYIKQSPSGDNITYDGNTQTIIMASDERSDCFCPLLSVSQGAPEVACNCSLGWHQHAWRTLLGKEVRVQLKESVLRGGKRCTFEIKVDGGLAP